MKDTASLTSFRYSLMWSMWLVLLIYLCEDVHVVRVDAVDHIPMASHFPRAALRGVNRAHTESTENWLKDVDERRLDQPLQQTGPTLRRSTVAHTPSVPIQSAPRNSQSHRDTNVLAPPPDASSLFTSYIMGNLDSILAESASSIAALDVVTSNETTSTSIKVPYRVFAPTKLALWKMEPAYLQQLMTPAFDLHLKSLMGFHLTTYTNDIPRSFDTDSSTLVVNQSTTIPMSFGGSIQLVPCNTTTGSSDATMANATTDACLVSFGKSPSRIVGEPQVLNDHNNGELISIDTVLMPEWTTFNCMSYMQAFDSRVFLRYSTFLTLWVASDLEQLLRNGHQITVLAPDNRGISLSAREFLLAPGHETMLRNVLSFHVLSQLFYTDATDANTTRFNVTTFGGLDMNVECTDAKVLFHGVPAISMALTKTSMLYRIEHLLTPPSLVDMVPSSSLSNSSDFASAADIYLGTAPMNVNLRSDGPFAEIPVRPPAKIVTDNNLYIPPL